MHVVLERREQEFDAIHLPLIERVIKVFLKAVEELSVIEPHAEHKNKFICGRLILRGAKTRFWGRLGR